jgi:hypothetical protein
MQRKKAKGQRRGRRSDLALSWSVLFPLSSRFQSMLLEPLEVEKEDGCKCRERGAGLQRQYGQRLSRSLP